MKDNFCVWDFANGTLEWVSSFKEAKEFIRDAYTDSQDGIHPDIENVMILKQVGGVVVTETGDTVTRDNEEVPLCELNIYCDQKPEDILYKAVPIEEEKPPISSIVCVLIDSKIQMIAQYRPDNKWFTLGMSEAKDITSNVTHWLKLLN